MVRGGAVDLRRHRAHYDIIVMRASGPGGPGDLDVINYFVRFIITGNGVRTSHMRVNRLLYGIFSSLPTRLSVIMSMYKIGECDPCHYSVCRVIMTCN